MNFVGDICGDTLTIISQNILVVKVLFRYNQTGLNPTTKLLLQPFLQLRTNSQTGLGITQDFFLGL